jgi:hypothetical protein
MTDDTWREIANAVAAQRNQALDTLAQVMAENLRLQKALAAKAQKRARKAKPEPPVTP